MKILSAALLDIFEIWRYLSVGFVLKYDWINSIRWKIEELNLFYNIVWKLDNFNFWIFTDEVGLNRFGVTAVIVGVSTDLWLKSFSIFNKFKHKSYLIQIFKVPWVNLVIWPQHLVLLASILAFSYVSSPLSSVRAYF